MKSTLFCLLFSFFAYFSYSQSTADDYFERGYYYMTADRGMAITLLTECIKTDPGYEKAYYHRGIAYFKEGEYKKALDDFDQAQRLSPGLSILWMYKGFAQRNLGNLDEALNCFSNYISKNPTDTTAYSYILRGKMKYELGDFQGAVKDYDMAIRLKPFEEKYQYYRFIALFDNKQYPEALEAVRRLTQINQEFYGYYFYKGNVFQEMDNYDSAIYMYNIAILKNSRNADSFFYRAKAYQYVDQNERAIEDLNKAISIDPGEPSYYAERGNVNFELKEFDKACTDWNKANELGYYEDFTEFRKRCQ